LEGIDCLQLLIDGNREGLGCLYKLFAKDLYRYGLAICKNDNEVSECLHDFFVFLWESRLKFSKIENPKAYLMISFKRRLIKQLAKAKHHDELDFKYENEYAESSVEEKITDREEQEEYAQRLSAAMILLSDREREAIHLKYFEKMKNEEIAVQLDISNQSVRNLLYRAIQNLKKNL
jgi:RNA polymerase sigma factor (sigma-70 family)